MDETRKGTSGANPDPRIRAFDEYLSEYVDMILFLNPENVSAHPSGELIPKAVQRGSQPRR
jgi:hypothetical protein